MKGHLFYMARKKWDVSRVRINEFSRGETTTVVYGIVNVTIVVADKDKYDAEKNQIARLDKKPALRQHSTVWNKFYEKGGKIRES